ANPINSAGGGASRPAASRGELGSPSRRDPGARPLGTGPPPPSAQAEGATMAEAISVSGPINGTDKTLSFETGRLAPQSQGAVVGRIGDTMVLVTANASH